MNYKFSPKQKGILAGQVLKTLEDEDNQVSEYSLKPGRLSSRREKEQKHLQKKQKKQVYH